MSILSASSRVRFLFRYSVPGFRSRASVCRLRNTGDLDSIELLFLLLNVSRTKKLAPLDARIFRFRACSLLPLYQSRFSLRELLNAVLAKKYSGHSSLLRG